jgi:mono/diheme cytochrome c family protein
MTKFPLPKEFFALSALVATLSMVASTANQSALSATSGEETFKQNCASCHAGGGNIVNAKKPVKGSACLSSLTTFKAYLLKPTPPMMAYPKIANDASALEGLYQYCKGLK